MTIYIVAFTIMIAQTAEFSWVRSQLYKECLQEFPNARKQDFEIMQTFLHPQKNETILEIWAWSWFFSWTIANQCNRLYVSDPSPEQLMAVKNLWKSNITLLTWWAEIIDLPENSVDAIRSCWALHHCLHKSESFENFKKVLKPWGRLILLDVLSWSTLAKHFDDKVAKSCITWHEVAFLSKEYFESLCFTSGFYNIEITDLDVQWVFKEKNDIWKFLYKLHAMTKTSIEECLLWAEEILWIEKKDSMYYLNRPLTVFTAKRI